MISATVVCSPKNDLSSLDRIIAVLTLSLPHTVDTRSLSLRDTRFIEGGSFKERQRVSTVYDSDDVNAAMMWSRDDGLF